MGDMRFWPPNPLGITRPLHGITRPSIILDLVLAASSAILAAPSSGDRAAKLGDDTATENS